MSDEKNGIICCSWRVVLRINESRSVSAFYEWSCSLKSACTASFVVCCMTYPAYLSLLLIFAEQNSLPRYNPACFFIFFSISPSALQQGKLAGYFRKEELLELIIEILPTSYHISLFCTTISLCIPAIMATAVSGAGPAMDPNNITATHPFTCNTCQVAFRGSDAQREHMRSDWQ